MGEGEILPGIGGGSGLDLELWCSMDADSLRTRFQPDLNRAELDQMDGNWEWY